VTPQRPEIIKAPIRAFDQSFTDIQDTEGIEHKG